MDKIAATKLATSVIPEANGRIGLNKVDVQALALTDANHDGAVSRDELITALVAGRVQIDKASHRVVPATAFTFPDGPEVGPQNGLAPKPWFQSTMIPGGTPGSPPVSVKASTMSGLSESGAKALSGKDFATVSASVNTPADAAVFLDQVFTYDKGRISDNTPPYGAFSADETLARKSGVCRDQMAVARDLLVAKGYNAELVGYWASNQGHAFTAYQDPKTKEWGILEYGKLFTPDQLHAKTPEEALMMVRPNALLVQRYANHGPSGRSEVSGLMYTPASRVYESFMAGPNPATGNGVSVSSTGITAGMALDKDKTWWAGMHIVTDPRLPYLKGAVMVGAWKDFQSAGIRVGAGAGYNPSNTQLAIGSNKSTKQAEGFVFVSAEEFHPDLLKATNVAGTGVNVGVGTHTTLTAVGAAGGQGADIVAGTGMALTNLKSTIDVHASRDFTLYGGKAADTRVKVGTAVGLDAQMLSQHYITGGKGLPVNTYVTAGIETRPHPLVGISAQGYLPITNHTNDVAASPTARLAVTLPYATIGTTQSQDFARYDTSLGMNVKGVNLAVWAAVDQDRKTTQTGYSGGVMATVASF